MLVLETSCGLGGLGWPKASRGGIAHRQGQGDRMAAYSTLHVAVVVAFAGLVWLAYTSQLSSLGELT